MFGGTKFLSPASFKDDASLGWFPVNKKLQQRVLMNPGRKRPSCNSSPEYGVIFKRKNDGHWSLGLLTQERGGTTGFWWDWVQEPNCFPLHWLTSFSKCPVLVEVARQTQRLQERKDRFLPGIPVTFCNYYFSELGQKAISGPLAVAGRMEPSKELGWDHVLIRWRGAG